MLKFDQPQIIRALEECDSAILDTLDFGVVAMDTHGVVEKYNRQESEIAGLSPQRVIGKNFFTEVAPCTNNYLVSQRFSEEETLDETTPYVFTLKMRPTKVQLRLLKAPQARFMYLLVKKVTTIKFDQPNLLRALDECDASALDSLDFGVVAMDTNGVVEKYNRVEGEIAGLSPARVIGKNFFTEVAPCTNNFLVSQRFSQEDAIDDVTPYVFTLKMRPTKVQLRLLKGPEARFMYLCVKKV